MPYSIPQRQAEFKYFYIDAIHNFLDSNGEPFNSHDLANKPEKEINFSFFRDQLKESEENRNKLFYAVSRLDFFHNQKREQHISHLMTLYNPQSPEEPIPAPVDKSFILDYITTLCKAHIIERGSDCSFRKIATFDPISDLDFVSFQLDNTSTFDNLQNEKLSPEVLDKFGQRLYLGSTKLMLLEDALKIPADNNHYHRSQYIVTSDEREGIKLNISAETLSQEDTERTKLAKTDNKKARQCLENFFSKTLAGQRNLQEFSAAQLLFFKGSDGKFYNWTNCNKYAFINLCDLLQLAKIIETVPEKCSPEEIIYRKKSPIRRKPNFDDTDPHGNGNR